MGEHLISKRKRAILYVIIEVILGIAGFGVGLLPGTYSLSLVVTFMLLGVIFSTLVEILMEVTEEEVQPVDVIVGERELKNMYKNLRDGACKVEAVWCSKYANVSKYFQGEIDDLNNNRNLHIRRLVNPRVVEPTDYQDHLTKTQAIRNGGRYAMKTTRLTELECVICEYEKEQQRTHKALFVFNDVDTSTPVLGILFDPAKKEKSRPSLAAIKSWFEKEWDKGGKVP